MGKTWRQLISSSIYERILELQKEHPDWDGRKIRTQLGKENPGPYKYHRTVWAQECTKQVNALYKLNPKKFKPRPGTQGELF